MATRIASGPCIWPMLLTYTIIIHKYPVVCLQKKVWTRYKPSHSDIQNDHPWGCPAYVLEPRLQDKKKLPEWMLISRRDQYSGDYPLHENTVVLARNLYTENISPEFNLVFDDYFDTFHAGEDQEPLFWS